jgi:hypothetical protein
MSAPPIALKELLSRFFNEQAMVNLETVIRVISIAAVRGVAMCTLCHTRICNQDGERLSNHAD